MNFNFQIKKYDTHLLIISLKGEILEKEQTKDLLIQIEESLQGDCRNLILNLNELSYMNSSGLSSLINILTKARNAGGEAVIFGLNERIKQLIVLTKLNAVFSIYQNEKEAIDALK